MCTIHSTEGIALPSSQMPSLEISHSWTTYNSIPFILSKNTIYWDVIFLAAGHFFDEHVYLCCCFQFRIRHEVWDKTLLTKISWPFIMCRRGWLSKCSQNTYHEWINLSACPNRSNTNFTYLYTGNPWSSNPRATDFLFWHKENKEWLWIICVRTWIHHLGNTLYCTFLLCN